VKICPNSSITNNISAPLMVSIKVKNMHGIIMYSVDIRYKLCRQTPRRLLIVSSATSQELKLKQIIKKIHNSVDIYVVHQVVILC
jgi:hypothetical protein